MILRPLKSFFHYMQLTFLNAIIYIRGNIIYFILESSKKAGILSNYKFPVIPLLLFLNLKNAFRLFMVLLVTKTNWVLCVPT